MEYVYTNISNIIKDLIKENNINIEELARYVGMDVTNLQNKLSDNLEKRNKFSLLQLEKIAQFFNCDLIIEFNKNGVVKRTNSISENIKKNKEYISFIYDDM